MENFLQGQAMTLLAAEEKGIKVQAKGTPAIAAGNPWVAGDGLRG